MNCTGASVLYFEPLFWAAKTCQLILCPAVIVVNLLLFSLSYRCTLMQKTLRYFASSISAANTIAATYVFAKTVYSFLAITWSACPLITVTADCKVIEAALLFLYGFCNLCWLGIASDRIWDTYSALKSKLQLTDEWGEKDSSSSESGRVVLRYQICQTTIPLFLCFLASVALAGSFLYLSPVADPFILSCNILLALRTKLSLCYCVTSLLINLISLSIYSAVLYFGRRRFDAFCVSRTFYSVDRRMRFRRAVFTTEQLRNVVLSHILCMGSGLAAASIHLVTIQLAKQSSFDYIDILALEFTFYCLPLLNGLLFPIVLLWELDTFQAQFVQAYPLFRFVFPRQKYTDADLASLHSAPRSPVCCSETSVELLKSDSKDSKGT